MWRNSDAAFAPGDYRLEARTADGLVGELQFTVEAGAEVVDPIRVELR